MSAELAPAREEKKSVVPDLIQRYRSGESLVQLAKEHSVSRNTIYNWIFSGKADEEHSEIVTDCLINRIADADSEMDEAASPLDISRAREKMRFSRQDFERRRPKLYGQQTQHQHNTAIQVIVQRETPQPVVVEANQAEKCLVSPQEQAQ